MPSRERRIHEDMEILLRTLGTKWITPSRPNGYIQLLPDGDILLGWLNWPSKDELSETLRKIESEYPYKDVVTFVLSGACEEIGSTWDLSVVEDFVETTHRLQDLKQTSPIVREARSMDDLIKLDPIIPLGKYYKFRVADEWKAFTCLRRIPVLIAYGSAEEPIGCIVVHGVFEDQAWIRRWYVARKHRNLGFAELLIMASLQHAKIRGFACVTGLISRRVWEIGMHRRLGFERTADVCCINLTARGTK